MHWQISLVQISVMNTDLLNPPMLQAIYKHDTDLDSEQTMAANALWSEVRTKVPPPKPLETDYGIVKGQEFVEHIVHRVSQQPNVLEWNYEVKQNRAYVTPRDLPAKQITLTEMTEKAHKTVERLDAYATRTINRRYIDATVKISQRRSPFRFRNMSEQVAKTFTLTSVTLLESTLAKLYENKGL